MIYVNIFNIVCGISIAVISFNYFNFFTINNKDSWNEPHVFTSIVYNILICCVYKYGLYLYKSYILSTEQYIYMFCRALFVYVVLVSFIMHLFGFNIIISFSAYVAVVCLNFIINYINRYVYYDRINERCLLITYNSTVVLLSLKSNINIFNMCILIFFIYIGIIKIVIYYIKNDVSNIKHKSVCLSNYLFVYINECIDNIMSYVFIIYHSTPLEFVVIYYLLISGISVIPFKIVKCKSIEMVYNSMSIVRMISFLFFINGAINPVRKECSNNIIKSTPTCISLCSIFLFYTSYICYLTNRVIYRVPKTTFIIQSIVNDFVSLFVIVVTRFYFIYKT